jgi:hypothetical protein
MPTNERLDDKYIVEQRGVSAVKTNRRWWSMLYATSSDAKRGAFVVKHW